ncbi:DNAJ protein JJJ1 homolog [Diospyros lotus]|uniref:DNAJ protein JJJ1 homolog n=1 Tax=Diospyros lotus TaxID=55363 RepID=UPI00224D7B49|nr:DNAJ protein JJJ1 homolog [Diospyros lotus]XP_052179926.1 DNAJ protein JJJ1 homolog [Diospyros lotus]XP_052179927.1 DNAJ protein JJJ1 homolog [Diospyros lotus]
MRCRNTNTRASENSPAPTMGSPEKRCLYEVLGLGRDCTADEIRSAYKKLALQRHPDKLVQSGVPEAEATASFQELVNAYEVLSDLRERAWYDSHRSQILFSGSNPSNSSTSIPNLFSFFSNSVFSGYSDANKGFYKVYGDVFNTIYSSELNFAKKLGLGLGAVKEAPLMGNLESPYAQVTAFYNYWLGFGTVMDFCWVDQYDAMAGPNRKSRRVMEEENKKLRKKARREYNETVRGLAEFVKKRDKRVIDMQVKRNEEMERKRMEEREKRKEMERQKMERARAYEEPDWAKVEEDGDFEEDNEVEEEKKRDGKELYCVVCSKKFKSEKQWKNHEQSKKHKEKVAELREAYGSEEVEDEETGDEEEGKEEELEGNVNGHGLVSADDGIDELSEKFGGSFRINKSNSDGDVPQSSEEEEFVDIENGGASKGVDESFGLEMDDDEASTLEAMVSGHRRRKNANSMRQPKTNASSSNVHGDNDDEEMDFMAYNNQKSARRKRGTKGEMGRRFDEEAAATHGTEVSGKLEGHNGDDEGLHEDKISSHAFVLNENGKGDGQVGKGQKALNAKSKNSSKGKKQKATSKNLGSICDTCGKEFESRNKLYKHLGDTGHATLKFR